MVRLFVFRFKRISVADYGNNTSSESIIAQRARSRGNFSHWLTRHETTMRRWTRRLLWVECGCCEYQVDRHIANRQPIPSTTAVEQADRKVGCPDTVNWRQWPGNLALVHSTGCKRLKASLQLSELLARNRSSPVASRSYRLDLKNRASPSARGPPLWDDCDAKKPRSNRTGVNQLKHNPATPDQHTDWCTGRPAMTQPWVGLCRSCCRVRRKVG